MRIQSMTGVLVAVAASASAWASGDEDASAKVVLVPDLKIGAIPAGDGLFRNWALEVGVYVPTSGEMRDAFEDGLIRLGLRPYRMREPSKWRQTTDITIVSASRKGNRMFLLPVALGLTRSFGDADGRNLAFVSFGAGPAFYDYAITRPSNLTRYSTQKVGASGYVEAGVQLQNRLTLTGRYQWFSESHGFDFSGVSASVAFVVARW